jgi:hypothetical protein
MIKRTHPYDNWPGVTRSLPFESETRRHSFFPAAAMVLKRFNIPSEFKLKGQEDRLFYVDGAEQDARGQVLLFVRPTWYRDSDGEGNHRAPLYLVTGPELAAAIVKKRAYEAPKVARQKKTAPGVKPKEVAAVCKEAAASARRAKLPSRAVSCTWEGELSGRDEWVVVDNYERFSDVILSYAHGQWSVRGMYSEARPRRITFEQALANARLMFSDG